MSGCLTPWFRSPFSDITGSLLSYQWYGRCADFELNAMECIEAYGKDLGRIKCEQLIKDFKECSLREKQRKRFFTMRFERHRQYWMGERSKEDRYSDPPAYDSYQSSN